MSLLLIQMEYCKLGQWMSIRKYKRFKYLTARKLLLYLIHFNFFTGNP